MSDDIFDFDIDAALETAEQKAAQKANAVPEILEDEADCEGCKIWFAFLKGRVSDMKTATAVFLWADFGGLMASAKDFLHQLS